MLIDLSIQNYRSFKNFYIDDLARVNLIVGMNNSGKTSLLEAVYLLSNQDNPTALINILESRGDFYQDSNRNKLQALVLTKYYQIQHIFHSHALKLDNKIYICSRNEQLISLEISLQPIKQPYSLFDDTEDINEADVIMSELNFSYSSDIEVKVPVREDGLIEKKDFRLAKQPTLNRYPKACQFITTNSQDSRQLARLWDRITLTSEEEEVIKALQILEPDVERISFTSCQTANSGILLKLRGQKKPIPIGSMGDGMRRLLTLATSVVTVADGVLLVDEIDTGLYYQSQTDMWRLILKTAQRLNIQVFATTHSWDCVHAFQEALEQSEDKSIGKLLRLSMRGEDIRSIPYTADELSIAMSQEIEVR